jgi:ABC-2 type transport system ATP-binding protein
LSVIEAAELAKSYGPVLALRGVSLAVEQGEIFGLLGRNGAGKSTLVKILLGIAHPTSGVAKLFGCEVSDPSVRRRVGFLPEDHRLPEYHSASSFLSVVGLMYGLSRAERARRSEEVLELVGLRDRAADRIRGYSKGMRQRLGIAQALLHRPEMVILDEPTDGVDPVGRQEIRTFILRLKEESRTVFINSHLLNEVEMTCDRVAILEEGQKVREGRVEELTRQANIFDLKLAGDPTPILPRLRGLAQQVNPVVGGLEVVVSAPSGIDGVIDALRAAGIGIRGVRERVLRLEDVFLRSIGKDGA